MSAFNIVRFKVRPGNEQQFIDAHRAMRPAFKGFLGANMIKTGDQSYCFVGEWRNFQSIVNARPQMISMLDQVRSLLEELGPELGVTDPISGDSVLSFRAPKKAAKKKTAKSRGPAKRTRSKKSGARSKVRKSASRKGATRRRRG
jgi:hypothetical protein